MKWESAAFGTRAFVTCDVCGQWVVVTPTADGQVDDACECGQRFRVRLKGWHGQFTPRDHQRGMGNSRPTFEGDANGT